MSTHISSPVSPSMYQALRSRLSPGMTIDRLYTRVGILMLFVVLVCK